VLEFAIGVGEDGADVQEGAVAAVRGGGEGNGGGEVAFEEHSALLFDGFGGEGGRVADEGVDGVAGVEEGKGGVAALLACCAGDEEGFLFGMW